MKMIGRGSAIDAYRYDSAIMICGKLRAKNRRKSGENSGVTKIGVHDVTIYGLLYTGFGLGVRHTGRVGRPVGSIDAVHAIPAASYGVSHTKSCRCSIMINILPLQGGRLFN